MGLTVGQEKKKNLHASYKMLCFGMLKRVLSLFESVAPQLYSNSPFLITTLYLGTKI